jgi:hypothetical protein
MRLPRCIERPVLWVPIAALVLISTLIATSAGAENAPPTVEIETPTEGTLLGLSVQVTGNAWDADGFNIDSVVELRWNDWEWFEAPSNPGGDGNLLYFGELIDLAWHTPGEHVLHARAFDGELYSAVVNVTVMVRDLADLVVLPTDISLEPEAPRDGDDVTFRIEVRNQGGEPVPEAAVELLIDGEVVDVIGVSSIEGGGTQVTTGHWEGKAGDHVLKVVLDPEGELEEHSTLNNFATISFTVEEAEPAISGWTMVAVGGFIVAAFLITASVQRWSRWEEPPRKS